MNPLGIYLKAVENNLRQGHVTEPTHYPALAAFIEALGEEIRVISQPAHIACGAPDFEVRKSGVPIGHIEAKDVGRSLDEALKTEQLKRYREALSNLILTNYLEFRWFVDGKLRLSASLGTHIGQGKIRRDREGIKCVRELLENFLAQELPTVGRADDLAKRLAAMTHLIRDCIQKVLSQEKEGGSLSEQFKAFETTLLPDLTPGAFADMFAQTLCYGLFSARVSDPDNPGFSRQTAAHLLPKTNPFLRELFHYMAGPDLDERVAHIVDSLVELIKRVRLDEVLKDFGRGGKEDPVFHFYETFLKAYAPREKKQKGVFYTPDAVVSYIVRSVDYLLKTKFNKPDGLADESVLILDPACGTGTFLYHAVKLIHERITMEKGLKGAWNSYVRENLLKRIFGFELMMAPYTIAHMKLSHLLKETGYEFTGDERLEIYLTNTLEEAVHISEPLFARFIAEEANGAGRIKREEPIMVVLGNPPYAGISANKGEWIDGLLKGKLPDGTPVPSYYEVDGNPLGERKLWLQDDYVKFLRFGQWRINRTGEGILAMITNHSYLDNPTFRGMRQQLMKTFDEIYVLDLHGNARKREVCPDGSKDENVFDIQQGVGIGIFVKQQDKEAPPQVNHAELWGLREAKYRALWETETKLTHWQMLDCQTPFYFFVPHDTALLAEYDRGWRPTEIMPVNCTGIITARDHFVIDFEKDNLVRRIQEFANSDYSDDQIRQKYFAGKGAAKYPDGDSRGWKLKDAREAVRGDEERTERVVHCLYRPFDLRPLYYVPWMVDWPRTDVMRHMLAGENLSLMTMRELALAGEYNHFGASRIPADNRAFASAKGIMYQFPLYLYPDPEGKLQKLFEELSWPAGKGGRVPNLNPDFVKEMEAKLGMSFVSDGQGDGKKTFGPEDVFHYIYALFHSPTYRKRYAEFLKIDFPRVPLTSDKALLARLAALGEKLVSLHLLEARELDDTGVAFNVPGTDEVEKVRYDEAHQRVYINKTQFFEPVPMEVWEFYVGGYQVCRKWLKDRKGRKLTFDDITHYQKIVKALGDTIHLMAEVDAHIPGWPM